MTHASSAERLASGSSPKANTPRLTSRLISRSPLYYGWIIVVAGSIGRLMTSPGQTYAVSIYIEHFIADLGISRSLVSTLYTVGTLAAALSLPFVGRQLDRRGPRLMIGLIAALFALACLYMGMIQNAAMLGVGFILIRTLGQGSLGMVSSNVINRWWVQRRGTVLGIVGVVTSLLGQGLFPSLVHGLIARTGWRQSYVLLGLMVALVMLPVGLIFFRREPEEYGLRPDGASAAVYDERDTPALIEENWTREEAVRTRAFWVLCLGLASIAMLSTGLQFHMVSVFEDSGLSPASAAAVYMPLAATSAVAMLASGILVDRIPTRYLLFAALIGQAISLVMAPRLAGRTSALAYGIVMGMTGGLQNMVQLVVWPNYFGRRHMGSIVGVASLIVITGSALGPMPMGIARDAMGSYTWALTASAALPLALGGLALFTRRPLRAAAAA